MKYLLLIFSLVFVFAYADGDKTKCSKNVATEETKMACKEHKGDCCKAMEDGKSCKDKDAICKDKKDGKCCKSKCNKEKTDAKTQVHKCGDGKCVEGKCGSDTKEPAKEIEVKK